MQSLPNVEKNSSPGQEEEPQKLHKSLWKRSFIERELFVVCLLVFGASLSTIISSQDAIHFALTWSLATTRTIWLDSNVYSGQLYAVQIAGHTYSALPPGLSFFSFGIVAISQMITPMDPSASGVYIATYFSCISGALAAVTFYKIARMFGNERASAYLAYVYAFGTNLWIYSRIYLPEALATCLGLVSVYLVLRAHQVCVVQAREQVPGESREWIPRIKKEINGTVIFLAFLSGLAMGLTVFVDNFAIFLIFPIFMYLAFAIWPRDAISKLASIFSFILGAFIGFIPIFGYDLLTTGNAFIAPYGYPFLGGVYASVYTFNLGHGLYEELFSPRSGLFVFTPFVVVSFLGLYHSWKEGRRSETSFLFALFLSILLPVSLVNDSTYFFRNTIGPAELVISIPYILLLALGVLNRMKQISLGSIVIYLLGAISIFVTAVIALTDPVPGPKGTLYGVNAASPFFTNNMPLFFRHSFLTWWSFFNNSIMYAVLIVAFPIILFTYWAFIGAIKINKVQLKEDFRMIGIQARIQFGKQLKAFLVMLRKI
jgi:hypothetical protein